MSGHPPSAPQQRKRPKGGNGRPTSTGGDEVKIYLHAVTDDQAALLTDTVKKEIKNKAGADVQFNPNPSTVPGKKILNICGMSSQIEAAVSLINQKTGSEETLSEQAQSFWLQWVETTFPDLDSRAYFLPPVYINRVPMTRQSIAGQDVLVLQTGQSAQQVMIPPTAASSLQPPRVQDSDIRDDAAMQRVLLCLQKMFEENKEAMFGMTQLQFGQYLGEPCYAAAAAQLPLPANLPPALPRNWEQGDFDVLLIHQCLGFIVFEVKAFGDNTQALNMSKDDKDRNIRKKLKEAMSQLVKAEAMLHHLSSDIAKDLPFTKMIAFPNLTAKQVQEAISCNTQLAKKEGFSLKDLCDYLGTTDAADLAGRCLCSDQLSDPKTPWDVSSDVLRELGNWWQRCVAAGAGAASHKLSFEIYKKLIARFCGPATTVTVPCTCPPRVSVKTLGQAVWCTGECYTAVITLYPEQVDLLNTAPPRLFVTGPPGTGKTVVLLLMGINWLRCGHPVYIVSSWWASRAACINLYHLLLQTQQLAGVPLGRLRLLQYNLDDDSEGTGVEKAVSELSAAASSGPLYVIADEAGESDFGTVCNKLLTQVPRLHLWAASCFFEHAPAGWQMEYLTRPIRSPPVVVREVEKDKNITEWGYVKPYSDRGVPDHTDGPPVRRLYHRGDVHSGYWQGDCVTCGREVASFLKSLRVGVTENVTTTSTTFTSTSGGTPPYLQWRDVLVLYSQPVTDSSGIVKGLKKEGIPVRVIKVTDGIKYNDIEDVAMARSDVVWVVYRDLVHGLERKVVVCLDDFVEAAPLHWMSRCSSQLVVVSSD